MYNSVTTIVSKPSSNLHTQQSLTFTLPNQQQQIKKKHYITLLTQLKSVHTYSYDHRPICEHRFFLSVIFAVLRTCKKGSGLITQMWIPTVDTVVMPPLPLLPPSLHHLGHHWHLSTMTLTPSLDH